MLFRSPQGEDILCAAVTSAVRLTECAVNDVLGLEAAVKVREKDASISLKLPGGLGQTSESTCQTLLTAMMVYFTAVSYTHLDVYKRQVMGLGSRSYKKCRPAPATVVMAKASSRRLDSFGMGFPLLSSLPVLWYAPVPPKYVLLFSGSPGEKPRTVLGGTAPPPAFPFFPFPKVCFIASPRSACFSRKAVILHIGGRFRTSASSILDKGVVL